MPTLRRTVTRGFPARGSLVSFTALALLLSTKAAHASTPAPQCQSGKNKVAGKYAACRQNAEAKLGTTGATDQYNTAIGKCETKFADGWTKSEAKAAGARFVDFSAGDVQYDSKDTGYSVRAVRTGP